MRRFFVASRLAVSLAGLSLVMLLAASHSAAQDKARRAAEPAKQAGKAAPEKQPAADAAKPKSGGRLPAYFAGVVTPEQRERIIAIQNEYAGKIKALQAELKGIQAKRDALLRELLTADQRQKIDELKTKAAADKAAKAAAAKDAAVREAAIDAINKEPLKSDK